jgi:hypothetical protein
VREDAVIPPMMAISFPVAYPGPEIVFVERYVERCH